MKKNEENRVVFYSKEDTASGFVLKNAEKILQNLSLDDEFTDINDLLEFYHIKQYFDNGLFLLSWDEATKTNFREKINHLWIIIKKFWLTIDENNIISYTDNIEFSYQKSFWELMQNLDVYKNISKNTFYSIINKNIHSLTIILLFEKIVRFFNAEVKVILLKYEKTAELLLSQDEQSSNTQSYFFPKCLTQEDKENIILKYIDLEDANLNYIRLIENSKDLRLSLKTKLKAQKKSIELNANIFNKGHSLTYEINLKISENQQGISEQLSKNNILTISYSKSFLDNLSNDTELFHQFYSLFDFIDKSGLITLVSKSNDLSVFEKICMISKNAYQTGVVFNQKNHQSYLQIILFEGYLNERNNSIENILESFLLILNDYSKEKFRLKFASKSSNYLEKIRIIAPELEFLLKQYNCYVKENTLDFELLEFDSIPVRFSEILSLVEKKYIYSCGEQIKKLMFYFFSDGSMLSYVKNNKYRHCDFYSLINKENLRLDDFEEYQQDIINELIKDKYLCINENSFLKIKNSIMFFLIKMIHTDGVLSYWHYSKEVREEIDRMIADKLVYSENTLFTNQETDYYNYFLNKKEFTNGFDLRNKYLHGTNSSSENQHRLDYYLLLRMMILTLLKIRDDILVKTISTMGI